MDDVSRTCEEGTMKAGGDTGEGKTRVDAFYKKIEFHKGDQRKTKAKPVVHWAQNPK